MLNLWLWPLSLHPSLHILLMQGMHTHHLHHLHVHAGNVSLSCISTHVLVGIPSHPFLTWLPRSPTSHIPNTCEMWYLSFSRPYLTSYMFSLVFLLTSCMSSFHPIRSTNGTQSRSYRAITITSFTHTVQQALAEIRNTGVQQLYRHKIIRSSTRNPHLDVTRQTCRKQSTGIGTGNGSQSGYTVRKTCRKTVYIQYN